MPTPCGWTTNYSKILRLVETLGVLTVFLAEPHIHHKHALAYRTHDCSLVAVHTGTQGAILLGDATLAYLEVDVLSQPALSSEVSVSSMSHST